MQIDDLRQRNREGTQAGLPSFCTSNRLVIDAALDFAATHNLPVLIEATCNQVNQFGGYTGMQPADFARLVRGMAEAKGTLDTLILGGDHLGPNPWRHLPAPEAMANACAMVRAYVEAGFTKIHLDASMACGGEPLPDFAEVARRAATLCAVAEAHAPDPTALSYIIGTEVPVPGGETGGMDGLALTTPARLDDTIATHVAAFTAAGLGAALPRVMAVVVQPGVDFSHTEVFPYDPAKAAALSQHLIAQHEVCFEAHSTDYQTTAALTALVRDHNLFLKVGPELTFALREALFLLSELESALIPEDRANLKDVVLGAMDTHPKDWASYYKGTPAEQAFLKSYSYSDRIRYYWDRPEVAAAIDRLMENLNRQPLPPVLISHLFGLPPAEQQNETAASLIRRRVQYVVGRYYRACGFDV
jgi:D-tagatose-1,6-bisphosphate aldolase subunit GatZ/KbaZ